MKDGLIFGGGILCGFGAFSMLKRVERATRPARRFLTADIGINAFELACGCLTAILFFGAAEMVERKIKEEKEGDAEREEGERPEREEGERPESDISDDSIHFESDFEEVEHGEG